MKYALRLSYLGKNYCGWQQQSRLPGKAPPLLSVQEVVHAALAKVTDDPEVSLVGSGRTDAGVNALGQVAHFRNDNPKLNPEIFRMGLNSNLPQDIRVMRVQEVPENFHAQQSASHKQYSYFFQQGLCPLPQWMDTTWWIQKRLDVPAMQEAVSYLVGEHDFKPFQASVKIPLKSTVRRILEAEIVREPMPAFPGVDLNDEGYEVIRIRLVGTGFLKQMVRGIAGTLLQVGEGRRPASDVKMILETLDRTKVGPTSPAKGLTLERVWYKIDGLNYPI